MRLHGLPLTSPSFPNSVKGALRDITNIRLLRESDAALAVVVSMGVLGEYYHPFVEQVADMVAEQLLRSRDLGIRLLCLGTGPVLMRQHCLENLASTSLIYGIEGNMSLPCQKHRENCQPMMLLV